MLRALGLHLSSLVWQSTGRGHLQNQWWGRRGRQPFAVLPPRAAVHLLGKQELHAKSLPAQKPEEAKKLEDPLGSLFSRARCLREKHLTLEGERGPVGKQEQWTFPSGTSPKRGQSREGSYEKEGYGGERVKFADPVARVVDSGGDRSGGEREEEKGSAWWGEGKRKRQSKARQKGPRKRKVPEERKMGTRKEEREQGFPRAPAGGLVAKGTR